MGIFRPGTNRLWAAFVAIYFLTAIGMDFYWLFSESGPIRWLAVLQAKLLGGRWVPKLTFLVLLLVEIVPVVLLKLLIERVTGARLAGPPETPPSDPQPR
jgi:hypothetical protein